MELDFVRGFEMPPYWLKYKSAVSLGEAASMRKGDLLGAVCSCPLSLREKGGRWVQLPIEPVVSVSGKNNIVKRNVLKAWNSKGYRRGSIKELWVQEDYEINISGVFISDRNGRLPENDIETLLHLCEKRETLEVQSQYLTLFGIFNIAIESFDFPFTRGMENQLFSIRAYSDDFNEDQLLIKL